MEQQHKTTSHEIGGTPTSALLRYPYGKVQRYHLQHVHLFASALEATLFFEPGVERHLVVQRYYGLAA